MEAPDTEHTVVRAADLMFRAVRLHDRSRFSWAVIGYPSGAIAERGGGALLIRLREDDANEHAARLSRSVVVVATGH